MPSVNPKALARERRKRRVRKKIRGTAARPRLSVFRSARHIYVQAVDDDSGLTLASASTLSPELKDKVKGLNKRDASKLVGEQIGSRIKEKGIERVVFDRNGFLYHGRVQALSEGARETGLKF
ncbi:MAG: 50S ribosomal protein L18 [Candidatus Adiutricales bacterium]|jgi:large subunit ribosomal protein L18